jgi:dihydrofolate synthase/folylpolyglutamate synthase
MAALCEPELEDPWLAAVDAIRVTGSNGKGSVCAITAALLEAFGLRTAVYTSPHVVAFNERLVIGGEPIAEELMEAAVSEAMDRVDDSLAKHPHDLVAGFEALTCAAIIHMTRIRPQAMVIEAGIGGRLDSTRVIPGGIVGLTSVDLEHTGLLGPTRELIALDKADLCPDNGVVVCGVDDEDLLRRLEGHLRVRKVELVRAAHACPVREVVLEAGGSRLDMSLGGQLVEDLFLPMAGRHQIANAQLAVGLVRRWLLRNRPRLLEAGLEERLRKGLADSRIPGRFELIHQEPDVLIDLAHTPAAIHALVETVRATLSDRRLLLVTGVSADKDKEAVLSPLLPIAHRVICTAAAERAGPVEEIHELVTRLRPGIGAVIEPSVPRALAAALEIARREGMSILVAGGLFLAAEARAVLRSA